MQYCRSIKDIAFSLFCRLHFLKLFVNMTHSSLLSIIIALVFVATVLSINDNEIVRIVNSGSSNFGGYTIELQQNGIVKWTVGYRFRPISSTTPSTSVTSTPQMSIRLPSGLVANVFQKVRQALPLNQFPANFCIKSVSFGTSLHLSYNGQQSPDLNCPLKDSRLISLNKVVREVVSALHIES